MKMNHVRNLLGLLAGLAFGLIVTAPLQAAAVGAVRFVEMQTGIVNLTQGGNWAKQIECPAPNVPISISVDGAAAVTMPGIVWTQTAPFIGDVLFQQMPAAARVLGTHTIGLSNASTTVQLADGSNLTIPGGTLTFQIKVYPDNPTGTPPIDRGWKKLLVPILVAVGTVVLGALLVDHFHK